MRIAELTGVDLRWLLTGQAAEGGKVSGRHPVLRRAAALLGDRPNAAGPLAAFLEILAGVEKFPAKVGPVEATRQDQPAKEAPPRPGARPPAKAAAPAETAAQDAPADARAAWIPVLGRTAAGVAHFWADGQRPEGVTSLDDLISRQASASGRQVRPATAAHGDGGEESAAEIITLRSPDENEVVEFVAAAEIKARYGDAFALRIDGDSMAPDIRHGDLVVLSPRAAAADGRAAVVQLEGQIGVTCKLYRRAGETVHLVPINDRYEVGTFPSEQVVWALRVLARVRA